MPACCLIPLFLVGWFAGAGGVVALCLWFVLGSFWLMNELSGGGNGGAKYNTYGVPCFTLDHGNRTDCNDSNRYKYNFIMWLPMIYIVIAPNKFCNFSLIFKTS